MSPTLAARAASSSNEAALAFPILARSVLTEAVSVACGILSANESFSSASAGLPPFHATSASRTRATTCSLASFVNRRCSASFSACFAATLACSALWAALAAPAIIRTRPRKPYRMRRRPSCHLSRGFRRSKRRGKPCTAGTKAVMHKISISIPRHSGNSGTNGEAISAKNISTTARRRLLVAGCIAEFAADETG